MTTFLRILTDKDKQSSLLAAIQTRDNRVFELDPANFRQIPGSPFAYWVSESVRNKFMEFPAFENEARTVKQGLATADDFRFVRAWWEVSADNGRWPGFAKGGAFSPFYTDIFLVVNWNCDGLEIKSNLNAKGNIRSNVWMLGETERKYFRRPGLTWPLRARRFAPQFMPTDCIFSVRGYSAFPALGDELLTLAVFNSAAFDYLFKAALGRFGFPEFIVGILQRMPWAKPDPIEADVLQTLAHRSWSLKRKLNTANENSHAFLLPSALQSLLSDFKPEAIESELAEFQTRIDDIAFRLYGFCESDRVAAMGTDALPESEDMLDVIDDAGSEEESNDEADATVGLLSWAVGVAFGRFDWRLATGERDAPPEPEPFDPLPAKSPGMLPDGDAPFHAHGGILLDDPGHPDDLARLVEEVLARVDVPVPGDVRRWLQRDFFPFHLQRYSKSRRKAPIYWPLTTTSGSYTLWVYYPRLTSQTLYTAINDYVEPKLKQVSADVTALRSKGAERTAEDEKQFESLQAFELELIELRDTLLKIAPTYHPNHDDGVQITAAPLWPLFRHKPWQKVLKATWAKLEKGDYDWAHLAMGYWPDRVVRAAHQDRSLAIAHDLEAALWEEAEVTKTSKSGKATTKVDWCPRKLTEDDVNAVVAEVKAR